MAGWQQLQQAGCGLAHQRRRGKPVPLSERHIAPVPTKQLIGAISVEDNGKVLSSCLAHIPGWDTGTIVEGFSILPQYPFHVLGQVLKSNPDLGMAGLVLFCHQPRQRRLIKLAFERDGEGAYATVHAGSNGCNEPAVDAAAQEGPHFEVTAFQPSAHRPYQARLQFFQGVFLAYLQRCLIIVCTYLPPGLHIPLEGASVEFQPVAGQEFLHLAVRRLTPIHGTQTEVCRQVFCGYFQGHQAADGIELTGEHKLFAVAVKIAGLLARPVPGQEQPVGMLVVNGKGKHAIHTMQHLPAFAVKGMQQGFCIAVGAAFQAEFPAYLQVIVYLPVEDDAVPVEVMHRLRPALTVEDGEAQMMQQHLTLLPGSPGIGAPVAHYPVHRACVKMKIHRSGNAAHAFDFKLPK